MRTPGAQTVVRILSPVVALLAAYLLIRGGDSPGGGFSAGLTAGLLVVLRHYVYGPTAVERLVGAGATRLTGVGLGVAAGTGLLGLVAGDAFLDVLHWTPSLPAVGAVELTTALAFETGIFVTVLGVVVAVVQGLSEP